MSEIDPHAFTPPSLEELAKILPNYAFEEFIAQGGMGAVYKARQKSLDREVAIKILPRELGADPEFHQSFETEARAMAKLNHPNLVGVYDYGSVDGMPFIVMELVTGQSLYYATYQQQLPPAEAVRMVKAICAGLAHAHENGIIHRDIKPANILLTPKGEPKIGDFGLAHPADTGAVGMAMGTPGYAAPEIVSHPESADKRSDLFAVGVILYELLTGHLPGDVATPPSQEVSCDPIFDKIVRRATHRSPTFRYQSAEAFSAALDEALEKSGKRRAVAVAPATPARAAAAHQAAPVASSSASGFLRNLAIIAILCGAIYVAWNTYQRKRNQREGVTAETRPTATQAAPPVQPPKSAPPADETAMESLTRLRPQLAAGSRTEMPQGTITFGDHSFFLVETPMPWRQAQTFAEAHGGHLAIVPTPEAVEMLAETLPDETTAWIGAGNSGRRQWNWLNGAPLPTAPAGNGSFAALSYLGLVRSHPANESLPFLIQWKADGTNPGSLEQALARTATALQQGRASFPVGTVYFDSRYFLLVQRSLTWEQAQDLAKRGAGHVMVATTPGEREWLQSYLGGELPENARCWLGGRRQGDTWGWGTGETWSDPNWAVGQPGQGVFLATTRAGTWNALPATETAEYFLIEWSRDPETAAAGGSVSGRISAR